MSVRQNVTGKKIENKIERKRSVLDLGQKKIHYLFQEISGMKERPQCDVGSAKKIGHLFQNSGGLEWKYDAKDMLRYVRNSSTKKKRNKMFVSVS